MDYGTIEIQAEIQRILELRNSSPSPCVAYHPVLCNHHATNRRNNKRAIKANAIVLLCAPHNEIRDEYTFTITENSLNPFWVVKIVHYDIKKDKACVEFYKSSDKSLENCTKEEEQYCIPNVKESFVYASPTGNIDIDDIMEFLEGP